MPSIEKIIDFDATPDEVFSIIENAEDFPRYSIFISEVKKTDKGNYQWTADIFGLEIKWEAEISENIRPVAFAWKSISGFDNKGSYLIENINGKARVRFIMEYNLNSELLNVLTKPLITKAMEILSTELMEKIEEELTLNKKSK